MYARGRIMQARIAKRGAELTEAEDRAEVAPGERGFVQA